MKAYINIKDEAEVMATLHRAEELIQELRDIFGGWQGRSKIEVEISPAPEDTGK